MFSEITIEAHLQVNCLRMACGCIVELNIGGKEPHGS
jgi:hypothetical protein